VARRNHEQQQNTPSTENQDADAPNQDPVEAQGTAQGDKNARVTEAQMDAMTADTAETLSGQPTKSVRLYQAPETSPEGTLADEVVQVNGHTYQIKRGVEVEVPETVYDVLVQAGRI
jgi:hypothetical protein